MAKKDIFVYTTKECSYCKSIKDTLDKENIKYTELPTSEEGNKKAWYDITNTTGMPTVPTIHYQGDYLVAGRDFPNPQALVNILKDYRPLDWSFSYERLTIERVKTLNYSMSMAFNRLDQLLRQIETKLNTENEHESTN